MPQWTRPHTRGASGMEFSLLELPSLSQGCSRSLGVVKKHNTLSTHQVQKKHNAVSTDQVQILSGLTALHVDMALPARPMCCRYGPRRQPNFQTLWKRCMLHASTPNIALRTSYLHQNPSKPLTGDRQAITMHDYSRCQACLVPEATLVPEVHHLSRVKTVQRGAVHPSS